MSKKIVICSDGTGNKGGSVDNTNVFRLYKLVDIQREDQIAFYDDGIGTESENTIFKMITRAFGFGFKKNILALYRYIAKHYEPGDKIYMFGFSRGAATVRALAGMIQTVGLLRNDYHGVMKHGIVDDIKLHIESMKAMRLYRRSQRHPEEALEFMERKTHGVVDIEMVGVWDTVSALGFPQDTSWLVIGLSKLIDIVSDKIMPHHYFNYQLDKNVKNVYHALSIDDNRHSFQPKVWNEVREDSPEYIEQVWFAGAHSNVGGGYPRIGLSMIPLDWMMDKAQKHGLIFDVGEQENIKERANEGGKLYNPRAGFWAYYRYKPRHIRDLTLKNGESVLRGNIKIHESVIRRMQVCDYYPILPNTFDVVDNTSDEPIMTYTEGETDVKKLKGRVNRMIKIKKFIYHAFCEISVALALLILYYNRDEIIGEGSFVYNSVKDLSPEFAHNFLYYAIDVYPIIGWAFLLAFILIYFGNKVSTEIINRNHKRINWSLLKQSNKVLDKKI